MTTISNPSDWLEDDGEVRELSAEEIASMKSMDALPSSLQETLRSLQKGPAVTEERVPVPISRSIADRFRVQESGGPGRIDRALFEWLDEHQAN